LQKNQCFILHVTASEIQIKKSQPLKVLQTLAELFGRWLRVKSFARVCKTFSGWDFWYFCIRLDYM